MSEDWTVNTNTVLIAAACVFLLLYLLRRRSRLSRDDD
jgi:hypothetical protein